MTKTSDYENEPNSTFRKWTISTGWSAEDNVVRYKTEKEIDARWWEHILMVRTLNSNIFSGMLGERKDPITTRVVPFETEEDQAYI